MVDARAKDKRRAEWEEKIAAEKKEVSALVDEEKRILESLSRRRRYINPDFRHRLRPPQHSVRHYSTAAAQSSAQEEQSERDHKADSPILNEACDRFIEEPNVVEENELPDDTVVQDGHLTGDEDMPSWVTGDKRRLQAIQKLSLRQLAIRLLLRPSVAHSYAGLQKNHAADFNLPKLNAQGLLSELNYLRRRISGLKELEDAPIDDLAPDLRMTQFRKAQEVCEELDAKLRHDFGQCHRQQISIEELLVRVARNMIQSPNPDRPAAFMLMIMGFSKMRQNDVVQLILRSILPHYFTLNFSLIIAIIAFFRQSKDLKGFDLFLQMLRGKGYPVNLGHKRCFRSKVVNGIEITVPPQDNYNVVIYSSLITAALRFDQPERADAWHKYGRNIGFMDNFATMYSYLKFYSIRKNWEVGTSVLRRALAFLGSTDKLDYQRVVRLIMLMVKLCDSCKKDHVSEALISAFISSGFDRDAPSKQLDCEFPSDPTYQRWMNAPESGIEAWKLSITEKCSIFTGIIGPQADLLFGHTVDGTTKQHQDHMLAQYSRNILLSTLGESGMETQSLNEDKTDPVPKSLYTKPVHTGESEDIKTLKSEIQQLKEMVFQLKQTQPGRQS